MSTSRNLTDDAIAMAGHENQIEFSREMTRWSGRAGKSLEADGIALFASGTDFPVTFNNVIRIDPEVSAADVLARSNEWFGELGRGYSITTSDWHGIDDDLQEAASNAGMMLLDEPPEMVIHHSVESRPLPDGITLEWVTDRQGFEAFLAVGAAAYGTIGMPPGVIEQALVDLDRFLAPWIHSVVAFRDDEPLAAAQVILSHGIGGVYWVGTVEAGRGAGLGDAVTRAVTNRGFEAGAAIMTLQASSQGEPIYTRMGYETIYHYHQWVRFDSPS